MSAPTREMMLGKMCRRQEKKGDGMMPGILKGVKIIIFTGYSLPLFELFMPVVSIPINRIPAYAMDLSDVITINKAFEVHFKGLVIQFF
jgi:hypothetical protein